jgi:hypothetical protein
VRIGERSTKLRTSEYLPRPAHMPGRGPTSLINSSRDRSTGTVVPYGAALLFENLLAGTRTVTLIQPMLNRAAEGLAHFGSQQRGQGCRPDLGGNYLTASGSVAHHVLVTSRGATLPRGLEPAVAPGATTVTLFGC